MDTRQKWETIAARHPDQAARERAKQVLAEMGGGEDAGPSPRFDMRTNSVPAFDPMDAAIKRRAAQEESQKMGAAEAFAHGAGQGAFGLGDEIGASGRAFGFNPAMVSGGGMFAMGDAALRNRAAGDPSGMKTYREGLGEARAGAAQAAEERPEAYYPGMLATAVAMPGPKGAPKGAGFGQRLGASVKGGTVMGTAQGVGASDKEAPGDIAQDALISGALGGALGAAGTTLAAPFSWAWRKLGASAPQRIANEAAEGPTQMTSNTARMGLNKAREGLAEEVIEGPSGNEVRAALRGPAKDAPAALKPRLDELSEAQGAGYDAFNAAGRGEVDPGAVKAAFQAARKEMKDPDDRAGMKAMIALWDRHVADLAEDGIPLTLREARAFTTSIGKQADSALGSLNQHATAALKDKLAAVSTKTMDDLLTAASSGDEALTAAAGSIREANKGMSPLLKAKKALKQREHKEATQGAGFRRLGKQAGLAATPGVLGAVTAEDGDKLETGLAYGAGALALQRALPALGGLADRGITGASIYAARHPNSAIPGVLGAGTRPFVPGLSLDILDALMKRREQENR